MKNASVLLFCLISIVSRAQPSPGAHESFKTPKGIIVCYANEKSMNTHVPEPAIYRNRSVGGRVQGTAFDVTYNGFSEPAKKAFQKAVDIWSGLITSNVTIKINATWQQLDEGVLGSCRPTSFEKNFQGAQQNDVWYPISLANKMANKDLNGIKSEIEANFSSVIPWHFDLDNPPAANSGKYDMVSVVLHEIGHGLGIFSAYEVSGSNGEVRRFFENNPCAYDLYLQTGSNNSVIGYTSPSFGLRNALSGNSLFFNSPSVLRLNDNVKGQVYAPVKYSSGSSIAHNDESAYPAGNKNSLMTPQIGAAESIHDPGPLTMGELNDIGWTNPILTHTPLVSVESRETDFRVVCTLVSGHTDYQPTTSTLKLNYLVNAGERIVLSMTATGTANEYSATIPKPTSSQTGTVNYAYYISVSDSKNRNFTWPGKTTTVGSTSSVQTYYKFKVGTDTEAPRGYHTPVTKVKRDATSIELEANFTDDFGVQGGVVEWWVNTTAQTSVNFTFVSDSTYKATLPLTGLNLVRGDAIKYRITVTDKAAAHNATSLPSASDYYTVRVVDYSTAQESYFNNFDDLKDDDFLGDFTIATPDNFDNGAIQSAHPYEEAQSKKKTSLSFTYELLTPIKVKASMGSIKFDEVVLVEPAKEEASFGTENFYDYVIVEGSTDKGKTWKAVANGWNSREKTDWFAKWDGGVQISGSSNAVGTSSLYHRRSLNLLNNFQANDEVILRFRLYSDPTLTGWGWAIDNLEIQVPDLLLHNHVDYVMDNAQKVELLVGVVDVDAIQTLAIDINTNGGQNSTKDFTIDQKYNRYSLTLTLSGLGLKKGNYINYRIRATNKNGYSFSLPSTGYFRMDILDLKYPVDTYSYSTAYNKQFAGNFISETQTSVDTEHPYASGFGLDYESNFAAILTTPVKINSKDPFFIFDEVLTLGTGDYAIVEGSKDGITWETLIDKYAVESKESRIGSLLSGNKFKAGDVVLLRFRLFSDKTSDGWGWKISNLKIQTQSSLTSVTVNTLEEFSLFPNPVKQGKVTILVGETKNDLTAQVCDVYSRQVMSQTFVSGTKEIKLPVDDLSTGIYFVTIIEGESRRTIRFVKL